MTAKRTPFSYNVGTVYHGFLTGNFYHYTLTISFCLQVSMARMEKNWFLIILYTSHSVLFKSWIIKNDPNQMTLSFSFDIIIFWYPLFRVSDMNKDDWEYWVENCYSHRAFFCSLRPGDGGYGWPFVSKLWHDISTFFCHVYVRFISKYMTIFLQTRIYMRTKNPIYMRCKQACGIWGYRKSSYKRHQIIPSAKSPFMYDGAEK